MRRLFAWLIRWTAILVLAGLTVAAVRTALFPLRDTRGWDAFLGSGAFWVCILGLASRVLLTRLRRGDPVEFLDTLEHELTHALAGYLTFAPPVSLTATLRKGGEVQLTRTNPVVALAPYFLPLFTTAAAAFTLILNPAWMVYGKLAVAFLLGSFAYRMGREFHLGQSDFREFGIVFSLVSIAVILPMALLGVLDMSGILKIAWHGEIWPVFLNQCKALINLGFYAR